MRMAYLMSRYPAISHTFFLQEILGLRKLGFIIETASINPPDRARKTMLGSELEAADSTFYIKAHSGVQSVWIVLRTLLLRPGAFFRGLLFTLQLDPAHLSRSLFALFYFVEALILGSWMRQRRLERMHIHFSGAVATVGMIAAAAFRIPYSLTVHGPDEFFDQELCFLQMKVERADLVICISDYCRSQLMRIAPPEHWHKLHVARLGIEPAMFFLAPGTQPAGPIELLTVGRLVPAKGQLLLLQAVDRLRERGCFLNVRLAGDGPDRRSLEEFVRVRELGEQVTFCGALNHQQIRDALERTSIFVLPSFAEGIPVALMEAMAMRIPCISTYVAGIPELIRDEQDGLLVPAGSVDALASAIERLAGDPLLRERLAGAGQRRVLDDYNLPKNLHRLASVFSRSAVMPRDAQYA